MTSNLKSQLKPENHQNLSVEQEKKSKFNLMKLIKSKLLVKTVKFCGYLNMMLKNPLVPSKYQKINLKISLFMDLVSGLNSLGMVL